MTQQYHLAGAFYTSVTAQFNALREKKVRSSCRNEQNMKTMLKLCPQNFRKQADIFIISGGARKTAIAFPRDERYFSARR